MSRNPAFLPVFDSMLACEAATGIPKSVQQQAKRDGCDAFDSHSRVNLARLLRWLFSRETEDCNWAERLKRAQALTAEIELKQVEGKLVEIERVHEQHTAIYSKVRAILVQKFETELPPKQDGLPAEKIAEMNRTALDEVLAILGKEESYGAPDSGPDHKEGGAAG